MLDIIKIEKEEDYFMLSDLVGGGDIGKPFLIGKARAFIHHREERPRIKRLRMPYRYNIAFFHDILFTFKPPDALLLAFGE
jgi:hypothetical protein